MNDGDKNEGDMNEGDMNEGEMNGGRIGVVVTERRFEAEDIVSLTLEHPGGLALPPFEPGAHIDVETGAGLVRQYSLWDAPGDTRRYRIAVLREAASRGGSRALHDGAAVGSLLRIGAPRNLFPLAPAPHTLLLAGGIGITPLLSMAQALAASNASFELHYCARSARRMAFRARLAEPDMANRVRLYAGDGGNGRLDVVRTLAGAPPGTRLYVCGPAGFMEAVCAGAAQAGWPASHLHLERFAAQAGAQPAQPAQPEQPFDLVLARSGMRLTVPAGRSAAAVLEQHGVFVPVSCGQGVCGTCLTGVLEGIPAHRDSYLTDEERAQNRLFTPCCSRASSPALVLDL